MIRFIDQWKKGKEGIGTYVLTISSVLMALIIGSLVSETLSVKHLGFSLAFIPERVDENIVLSLLLLPFAFGLLAITLSIKYIHRRSITSIFTSREKTDWKRFFLSFGLWGIVMFAFLMISKATGAPIEWNFNPSTFVLLFLVSMFIMPLQTMAEEVFFRGLLLQGFGMVFKKTWISLLITSVLFGLLHGSNPEVMAIGKILLVYYIWTGLFLGLITVMDEGLELAMGYHTINNIFAAIILTNDWQAFTTDALFIDKSPPAFAWDSFLTLFLLQPLLVFVFAKIYKWKDWKHKLLS